MLSITLHVVFLLISVEWNLSNTDTLGTEESVLISGVVYTKRVFGTAKCVLSIELWYSSCGVLNDRFHCICTDSVYVYNVQEYIVCTCVYTYTCTCMYCFRCHGLRITTRLRVDLELLNFMMMMVLLPSGRYGYITRTVPVLHV